MDAEDKILITVDVEDWFMVENLRSAISGTSWSSLNTRVENNVLRLLDLFDELAPLNGYSKISCTFFILGWIAERFPQLVEEIHNRGHEAASHGYGHSLCNSLSAKELKADLLKSRQLLEDITGKSVSGYRAPNFSINDTVLKTIEESGYSYDSSFNSFSGHGRYGIIDVDSYRKKGVLFQISETFAELPLSNILLENPVKGILKGINKKTGNRHSAAPGKDNKIIIPWSGGGYFRLFPYFIFRMGVEKILKTDGVYIFYLHPWEIDPDQPRISNIPISYKFRHYINLDKTYGRLKKFIMDNKNRYFSRCDEFISLMTAKKKP